MVPTVIAGRRACRSSLRRRARMTMSWLQGHHGRSSISWTMMLAISNG
jgi:hypothetical protein